MPDENPPVLFLKGGCPHCLKVRLFLLESGLLGRVTSREFRPGEPEEAEIRGALQGKIEKTSFPALKLPNGDYMIESDAIIARLAELFSVQPETLPIFSTYAETVLPRYLAARRELKELKRPA